MINKKISFLIIFLLALVFSFGLLNKSLAQIISCGNGTCESGEDYINCPYDCSGQPAQATGSSTTSSSGGSTSTSSGCICTHQFSFSDGKYCITATTNTGDNLRCIPDTYSYDHRINECVQMGPGCTFTPTNTRCCAQDYKMEFAPTNDTIQYCVSKRLFSGLISDDKNYIQAQFLENFNGGNQCVWVTSQNSCTPPNNSCSNSSPTTPSSSSGSGSPTPSYTCGWGGAYGNYCDPNGTCPPGQKCAEHSSNQCGCITPNVCGNGVLEWGYSINGVVQSESCDDGAQNGLNDKCTKNCKYVCGARNNQNVCADDECPNPGETCAYDSSTNTCSCLPPCGGGTTTNPQCTGRSCPSGEVCTTIITANVNNNTTVGRCECKEPCGSIDPLKFSFTYKYNHSKH
ncbi:MAG: hypothetical protein HYR97_07500 [Candidatus Melainabacteria bacterium]|nr:hypothetical protein [Candidatus Melainabacteria bacterium]